MKKLIICEGQNDSLFLEQICDKLNVPKPKIFDQRTNEKLKQLKDIETVELRRFFEKSNPNKILVKSEAGKDKAIMIYSHNMFSFIQTKELEKTILMLDLDKFDLEKRLKKIQKIIINKKVGERIIINSTKLKETESINLLENSIHIKDNNQELGKFYLVLFNSSLEDELDKIDSRKDVPITDKISKFVETKEVQDVFSLLLN